MRVIGGSARGRRLAAFAGNAIRPTSDRVREALFSILTSRLGSLTGIRVLDLFAGSGALGIEALSRGAAQACFVDSATDSIRTLQQNLASCHLQDRATVVKREVQAALAGMAGHAAFDLVFIDPPYGKGFAGQALQAIAEHGLLAEDGLACVETGRGEDLAEAFARLQRFDQRRYGSTVLHFYQFADQD